MGKQISVLRIKGSVGEVTGYKMNTSSKTSKSGDFIRSKATSVANPRSYAQAKQRAKARPAQLFYDAFSNVENHAFFPLDKAVRNRNMFLSLAMKLDYVPDVKKGEAKLPFAPYQVSKGSLGLDSLCVGEYMIKDDSSIKFNVGCDEIFDENEVTVAYLSSVLLANNPRLMNGEELTFMAVLANESNSNERWAEHVSFVIDESDNTTLIANLFSHNLAIARDELTEFIVLGTKNSAKMLCAALIISSKTDSSWRYTNSFMNLTAYAIDGFDWKEREIVESYMNESRDRFSDKILQQADNVQGEIVPVVRVANGEITLKQGVTGTPNPKDAAIAEMNFGTRRVVVSDRGQLQWYNDPAKTWTPVVLTDGQDSRALTIAETTWAGSQTITIAECQAAGF